ncbi:MAG: glycosyltransferase [Candidatus Margulisbacteria bacterium]|nr:glycosyltransferase [Candidatus Margulisiibacteriota bacterium]
MCKPCLCLFIKFPEQGKVKTRLAESIGFKLATKLYTSFVEDVIYTLSYKDFPMQICYDNLSRFPKILNWLGGGLFYAPQRGADLGGKLKNCFKRVFKQGYSRVIIIGSDAPDVPPHLFDQAFTALNTHDIVIGPTKDGGYYLIGFNKKNYTDMVFNHIPWSTPQVYEETLKHINQFGLSLFELPSWQDVDVIDDLAALVMRSHFSFFQHSKTMEMIRNHPNIW